MANEIKGIDSSAASTYIRNLTPANEPSQNLVKNPVPEVTVSNQVDNLIRELASSPDSSIDDNRIDAMISALKNGDYKIDYNRLASTLVTELINQSTLPGDLIHGK